MGIGRGEVAGLEGEALVSPEGVEPQLLGPRRLGRRLAVEEQDVGLDTASVENTRWQPEQGVDGALLQQATADRLTGAAFKEPVVWDHDGRSPVDLEQRSDMLKKVQLLVGRGCPEVLAQVAHFLALGLALGVDHFVRGLPAERRIRKHHAEVLTWPRPQRIAHGDKAVALGSAESVREWVHSPQE